MSWQNLWSVKGEFVMRLPPKSKPVERVASPAKYAPKEVKPAFLGSLIPIPGGSELCKLACKLIPNATARSVCEAAC
jgi:hypothetical protein